MSQPNYELDGPERRQSANGSAGPSIAEQFFSSAMAPTKISTILGAPQPPPLPSSSQVYSPPRPRSRALPSRSGSISSTGSNGRGQSPAMSPVKVQGQLHRSRPSGSSGWASGSGPSPAAVAAGPSSQLSEAAVIQSARMRVSSRDQEAMRRMRSVMMEHSRSRSGSTSSSSAMDHNDSPISPVFPGDAGDAGNPVTVPFAVNVASGSSVQGDVPAVPRKGRPRASTLSQVVTADDANEDVAVEAKPHVAQEAAEGDESREAAVAENGIPPGALEEESRPASPRSGRISGDAALIAQPDEQVDAAGPQRGSVGTGPEPEYTVAVVGAQGVGKSTFIAYALRSWGHSPGPDLQLANGHTATRCLSQIQPGRKFRHASIFEIVELDIAALLVNSNPESGLAEPSREADPDKLALPAGLPACQGVVLCYDASRAETIASVAQALEQYTAQGIPTVLLACKTDPDVAPAVDPAEGNSLGEPRNVGLIEVTSLTSEGRGKMKNGLRWLLYKIEQRHCREQRRLSSHMDSISSIGSTSLASFAFTDTVPSTRAQSLMTPSNPNSPLAASSPAMAAGPAVADDAVGSADPVSTQQDEAGRLPPVTPVTTQAEVATKTQEEQAVEGRERKKSNASVKQRAGPGGRLSITTDGADRRSSAASMAWALGAKDHNRAVATPSATPAPLPRSPSEADLLAQSALPHSPAGQMAQSAGSNSRPNGAGLPSAEPAVYLSIRELFTRLFSSIVSADDEPFVQAFFMTYRRFCLPHDLMQEFLRRYKALEQYTTISPDVRNWALMKITGALIDWTRTYPGDLEDDLPQSIFRETLALVLRHTFMAHLAAELTHVEANLYEAKDLDKSWAMKAGEPAIAAGTTTSAAGPATPGGHAVLPASDGLASFASPVANGQESLTSTPAQTRPNSFRLSRDLGESLKSISSHSLSYDATAASSGGATSGSLGPGTTSAAGSGRLSSRPSTSDSRLSLGRANSMSRSGSGMGGADMDRKDDMGFHRWAQAVAFVLTTDPRTFALELTRLQWELFRPIRSRDVLRHDLGKERDDPVGLAIAFFNHLSRWVTTLILAHPKAKHRARVYDRFMHVCNQLRQLNNYDSLYAVMAGMRETSVHRLTATHAVVLATVSEQTRREFDAVVRLMDPRGGYLAYREALKADLHHGAAVIPLLTTTLGLVSRLQTVRPEDVRKEDGRIQWDKFAKFGEYLTVIPECQAKGAPVLGRVSPAFRAVLDDTPVITEEDSLFERSRMLEPPGGQGEKVGGGGSGAKVLRRLAGLA